MQESEINNFIISPLQTNNNYICLQHTTILICQAHLLADLLEIPLMYILVLRNNFLKKKKKKKDPITKF